MTNKTFGKLVAIKPTKLRSEGTVVWECQCLCGRKKLVSAKRLLKGDVKSCGCLKSKKHHIENKKFGLLTVDVSSIGQKKFYFFLPKTI